MYIVIFFMKDGSVVESKFKTYPTEKAIADAGFIWDDIISYETHY